MKTNKTDQQKLLNEFHKLYAKIGNRLQTWYQVFSSIQYAFQAAKAAGLIKKLPTHTEIRAFIERYH